MKDNVLIKTCAEAIGERDRLAKSVVKNWRKGAYLCNFCSGTDGKHTPHCVVPLARRIVEGLDDHE